MGLILKDKITQLMKGYPTVSDKYNVWPGTLAGSVSAKFGDVLIYSSTSKGYYEVPTGTITLDQIAGINVSTNVKLVQPWGDPNAEAVVAPGEALNILYDGFVAVELDSSAVKEKITAGAKVAILLATGKLTTSGVAGATDLPNYYFTGTYDDGSKIIAEICVK
jgi:hypothetical protein